MDNIIHPELIEIGLQKVSGTSFEHFVNDFYPALAGIDFIPLGGNKDGGADAMLGHNTWQDKEPGVFYQASIQKDHRSKIRDTIARLREFGRDVRALVYVTSRKISKIDSEEQSLGKETGVQLKIRDGSYLASHINDSQQTRGAFLSRIGPHIEFLKRIGAAKSIEPSKHVKSPSVFVFLRQEIERRTGDCSLSEAIVDSLILWALEGTDPDKGIFKTQESITRQITEELPFVRPLLEAHLFKRLEHMSSKGNPSGREVRHHKAEEGYCLPYEMRLKVQEENATEEALRIRVLSDLERRVEQSGEPILEADRSVVAEIALRAIQLTFEREGLEFAAFLENKEESSECVNVSDSVDLAIHERSSPPQNSELFKAAVLESLRGVFYSSTPDERLLLGKLARTYSLFFCLKVDTRIVTYFQEMASDFHLFVGSDLVVRALSERYVRAEDQRVRTLLRMLAECGATLVLAEPVLQEVMSHLRSTMVEYETYLEGNESDVTYSLIRNSPKILIRAYFYAKLFTPEGIRPPTTWADYIQQFCSPASIGSQAGLDELRRFLLGTFHMRFMTRDELEDLIKDEESQQTIEEIVTGLKNHKAREELARNDALMAVAVYRYRKEKGEQSKNTEFGYRTWWLTGETSILGCTKKVMEREGSRYMMRPEFVLNFITLSPKLADVRRAYESVFPSLLGIRLANRVKEQIFRDMMKKIRAANDLEPGRREALIAQYSDQLKSDFQKVYDVKIEE